VATNALSWCRQVFLCSDRDIIISGSWDDTVRIWDPATSRSIVIDLLATAQLVAQSADSRLLFVGAGRSGCVFRVT